jgi:uncharacterized peroxidase-related enzyme
MSRLQPLPSETTPELKGYFDFFIGTLGFTPNSVLTMQRKPKLVQAFAQLNAAVMDPEGEVDLGFRRLIGYIASRAAGCLYCQAHTLLGAKNFGIDEQRLEAIWRFRESPLFSAKEKTALEFSLAAASSPNAVTDAHFDNMRVHWSESQIVEILGVIAMFGFLNRWNDSMGTPIEAVAKAHGHQYGHEWQPGKHERQSGPSLV